MNRIKFVGTASLIGLLLLFVTGKSLLLYVKSQKDYNRIVANQVKLTDSLTYYRDRAGREVAISPVLEYKLNEALKVIPELQQQLKNLKIKPARIESISETGINQQLSIKPALRDTNIIQNHITVPAKTINYRDPWYKIWGIIVSDTAKLDIKSSDTIIQVVSLGERVTPWLWFFSRRKLVQSIQSRNPNNHISYSRYIKVKK